MTTSTSTSTMWPHGPIDGIAHENSDRTRIVPNVSAGPRKKTIAENIDAWLIGSMWWIGQ